MGLLRKPIATLPPPRSGTRPGSMVVAGGVSGAPRYLVEQVQFEQAARFVTIGADSPHWQVGTAVAVSRWAVEGAFVRVEPPVDAPDDLVEGVRARVAEAGALAVRVRARRRTAVVAEPRPAPAASARAVVLALVEEARTADRPALRAHVESVLAEAGL